MDISPYKSIKALVADSLKGEEAEINRGRAFLEFISKAKHENGKAGTLDNIPETLVEEVYEAATTRYFSLHTKPMAVLVTTEGTGDAKTHKAQRYEPPAEGEPAPEGKVHSLNVKATCLMEKVDEAEPSRKAALVFVRARLSDYKRGALNSLIRQAKKALGGAKRGGGKADAYKVFAAKQMQMLLDRAKKREGKDKTVPAKAQIVIARANAAWLREVFGDSGLTPS